MVDIKAAVAKARQFVQELFPVGTDLRLEEVAQSGSNWLITFSFPGRDITILGSQFPNSQREYKTVEVDAETGEPKSVKIRVLSE